MAEDSGAEKTEKASGKRREEARKKGQVAKSQEVSGALLLLAGMTLLVGSSGHFAKVLGRNTSYLLSQAHVLRAENQFGVRELLNNNLEVLVMSLGPLFLGVLIAGVGANVLQFGFRITPEAMNFNAGKLNPITGMKKFFQKQAFFELGKNLVKIAIITLLATAVIRSMSEQMYSLPLLSLPGIVAIGKMSFMKLMAVLLFFTALLAVIDWFWQKHSYEESLKMSKQEVKEEHKDIEGDPQIKARIKGMQYEMARKRMLADVPTADVVITNPTHFAVAIRYQPGSAAPIVVAKGQDHIAQTIKKIARKARVPIIENKPLARSLYRQVEIGKAIPESLFQAVAEVLAYVYRLKKA
jgi:flagellar biosynthetic protein FlhB